MSKSKNPSRKAPSKKAPAAAPARKSNGKVPGGGRGGGKILVTGATGFLGKHLVRQLVERHGADHVRTLARRSSLQLERLGVEQVAGDVTDASAVTTAVSGCTQIYHLAGFVSRRHDDGSAMYRVHVEGTRTLLSAAHAAKAGRIVVVSTSGTIAVSDSDDAVHDESAEQKLALVSRWPYYLSKIYQERLVTSMSAELGLDVVLVLPSLLLGPGDDTGSSTGDVEKVVRGRLPIIPKGGGVAFVDARDAAAACILAMDKGQAGERYLVSAANMTLESFLGRVARLAEVPSPRAMVAPGTMKAVSGLVEAIFSRFGATSPLDRQSVEMAEHTWYVDAGKAKAELGFAPRDAQETLADTVRDIQRRHNLGRFAAQGASAD